MKKFYHIEHFNFYSIYDVGHEMYCKSVAIVSPENLTACINNIIDDTISSMPTTEEVWNIEKECYVTITHTIEDKRVIVQKKFFFKEKDECRPMNCECYWVYPVYLWEP